jgi:hypothetical protein
VKNPEALQRAARSAAHPFGQGNPKSPGVRPGPQRARCCPTMAWQLVAGMDDGPVLLVGGF